MFLDRSRKSGPHLEWRIAAFAVAAVLGITGIYLEERWMTLSAVVVLLAGMAVRLASREREPDDADEEAGEDRDGE